MPPKAHHHLHAAPLVEVGSIPSDHSTRHFDHIADHTSLTPSSEAPGVDNVVASLHLCCSFSCWGRPYATSVRAALPSLPPLEWYLCTTQTLRPLSERPPSSFPPSGVAPAHVRIPPGHSAPLAKAPFPLSPCRRLLAPAIHLHWTDPPSPSPGEVSTAAVTAVPICSDRTVTCALQAP